MFYKIVNFITTWAWFLKLIISLKSPSLQQCIGETNKAYSNADLGPVYHDYELHQPPEEAEVLAPGHGHISHIVRMHYFFKVYLLYSFFGKNSHICSSSDFVYKPESLSSLFLYIVLANDEYSVDNN